METLLEKYLTPDNITFMLQAAVVSVVIAALALTFGLCLGILAQPDAFPKTRSPMASPPSMWKPSAVLL